MCTLLNENFSKDKIKDIYKKIKYKLNTPGIDGKNIKIFNKDLDNEIDIINRKILDGTYKFSIYKEKLISKGRNKFPRVISIPTIRDKLVLKIMSNILIKEFNRSEMSIYSKISSVKKEVESGKFDCFIKIDIKDFYPSIDHNKLIDKLRDEIEDQKFINLLEKAIKQVTASNKHLANKKPPDKGIPQGLSISNILSSIYLISLDNECSKYEDYKYFRYVDDILILCKCKDKKTIFKRIQIDIKNTKLERHKLSKNKDKTSCGEIKDWFNFLGYSYSLNSISVRKSSINRMYNSIANIFTQYKYLKDENKELLYWRLNLRITGCRFNNKRYGWLHFFSQINNKTLLFKLDYFIKNKLEKIGLKKDKGCKIKSFIRTYNQIVKNSKKTNYIPDFSVYLEEEKKELLNMSGIKYESSNIDKKFNNLIFKEIKDLEKDIQVSYY